MDKEKIISKLNEYMGSVSPKLKCEDDTEYIPEQCTGLKDKNGELIYEGDVVSVPEFYNGIPTGKIHRYKVSYKHAAFNIHGVNAERLEVIGNIHEKPRTIGG